MKSVVVIVLSWNKKRAVIECIDRVKSLTGADVQIVVVDNASVDDSVDVIGRAHPDVTILREPTNRGFAGGVNRGLAEADRRGADFAWLLNDDTTFDDSVLVPLLAAAALHPDGGLFSPLLRDLGPDGGIQFENGIVDWRRAQMGHNFPDAVYRERIATQATPIVAGTAMLCDLRAYRAIGPFDERFFAYWEDTDYAVRAARAGFASEVVRASTVAHAAPSKTQRPPYYHYYMTRNEALFWDLHFPGNDRWRWKRRWLADAFDTMGRQRDFGDLDNAAAIVDGIWDAWKRRYGAHGAHRPAPRWLRRMMLATPFLWSSLIQGKVRSSIRRMLRIG